MPDLRGLSARDAMRTLMKLGLSARMSGQGVRPRARSAAGHSLRGRRNLPAAAGPPPFGVAGRRRTAMTWAALHGVLREKGSGPHRRHRPGGGGRRRAIDRLRLARVEAGDVFVALKGLHADGTAFARQAIDRGAVAVVSEQPAPARREGRLGGCRRRAARRSPCLPRRSIAIRAARCRSSASPARTARRRRRTSWRPSSTRPTSAAACSARSATALDAELRDATHTTPEAPELQALLREMVDAGCRACAMEVSSHALSLRRVDAMTFAAGVFTNLTRDHLDFHADMEELLPGEAPAVRDAAARRAEPDQRRRSARAFADRGRRPAGDLCDQSAGRHHARTAVVFARRAGVRRADAARDDPRQVAAGRPAQRLQHPGRGRDRARRSTCRSTPSSAASPRCDGVPGRFQVVSSARDEVTVVVDYAHTDDALRNLLETARPLARGRLITVFGCGGDRDRTKRPLMGAVAGRLSDRDRDHLGQSAQRGSGADHRGDPARSHRRHPARQRSADARDRRPSRGDRRGDRAGAAGRSRAGRRQGAREVPGDRQPGAAVRRCRGRARSARSQAERTPVLSRADAVPPVVVLAGSADCVEPRRARAGDAVHHRPHGRRQPLGAGDQPAPRAVDDPQAARVPDRPGDPAGGPDLAPAEGRDPDDGRPADPDGRAGADAALGGSHERLRLDCRPDDSGLRRRRLPRRLPEDRAPRSSRPVAALQDGRAGRRSRSSVGIVLLVLAQQGSVQHPTDLSVLQESDSGFRVVVPPVHRLHARRVVERGQPHRRARWSGHQHVRDRCGHVHGARVCHRPPRAGGVPAAGSLRRPAS